MSSEQLATRVLAEQSKISGDKMRKAELNKEDFKKIAKVSSELENLNLVIDDNPILTVASLRTRARRLKRLYDIDMIIIDYLQLMSGSQNVRNDGRVQEISEITRGLKAIAKELNIPIVPAIITNFHADQFPLEGRILKTDDEIRALFHLPKQLHVRRDKNGDIDQVTPPNFPTVKQHYV